MQEPFHDRRDGEARINGGRCRRKPLSIGPDSWLRKADQLVAVARLRPTLCRRMDLPDVDVAQAGCWSSLEALNRAYQQPEEATILRVVTHRAALREVK